jgi:hypothetical protein
MKTITVIQDQDYFMDEDMEASDQVEQLDATVLKRKRVEEADVATNAKPASKATGKPVLNTRALRSVLKGGRPSPPGPSTFKFDCHMIKAFDVCMLVLYAVFVVQAVPNYAQPW